MTLGERLRKLREERKMSQRALANEIGIGNSTISRIEAGAVKPDSDTIEKLAGSLNTTPAFLMGWDDDSFDYGSPEFLADSHGPQYNYFLKQNNGDEVAAGKAYRAFKQAEAEDAQKEMPPRRKLRSVARIEEVGITEDEDEDIRKYVEFLISQRDKDE